MADVKRLEKWLVDAEKILKSPVTGMLLTAIAPFLPKAGITPEQLAAMKARLADASARKERARQRAGSR